MLRYLHDLMQQAPLDDEAVLIEDIAQRTVREGMGTAAVVMLESMKPMAFIGSQAAIAATPLLGSFIAPVRLERFAHYFSNRVFVERVIARIEELEDARRVTSAGEPPVQDEKTKESGGDH